MQMHVAVMRLNSEDLPRRFRTREREGKKEARRRRTRPKGDQNAERDLLGGPQGGRHE